MTDQSLSIKPMTEEEEESLKKSYHFFIDGAIKYGPEGWLLPSPFSKLANRFNTFKVNLTDVFLFGFPKTGTTWLQEIVWTMHFNPDLDNPKADVVLDKRSPSVDGDIFLNITGALPLLRNQTEAPTVAPSKNHSLRAVFALLLEDLPSPRIIRSHLALRILPPNLLHDSKVIYIARDPRDVIASYYHYCKLHKLFGFTGTLDEFIDDFVNDRVPYSPYWSHVKQAWEKRDHPNFCFVFYEDLRNDLVAGLKRIDKLLGTNLTEKQIQNVAHYTSFEQMKEKGKITQPTNPSNSFFNKKFEKEAGGFFRKGKVGDWKNRFTPEQMQKINAWMATNLQNFGNEPPYNV